MTDPLRGGWPLDECRSCGHDLKLHVGCTVRWGPGSLAPDHPGGCRCSGTDIVIGVRGSIRAALLDYQERAGELDIVAAIAIVDAA